MSFSSCPECGETNYEEDYYSTRKFDCGFQGQNTRRASRCGGKKSRRVVERIVDDSASRYRMGLLDAAQLLDGITADIVAVRGSDEHTERCRALAQQMRVLAGHQEALVTEQYGKAGSGLIALVWRKLRT